MDNVLGVAFLGLLALFSVWNATSLYRYLLYRRLAPESELTWRLPRPWFYNMSVGIGFFMVSLTALSVFVLNRPLLATAAQALMAVYYAVLFPLTCRIERGFYRRGIWFERAFVPYAKIERLDWKESPAVVLVGQTNSALGLGYRRLQVPSDRFAAARRVLANHIEDRTLTISRGVLGLAEADAPAQEQV